MNQTVKLVACEILMVLESCEPLPVMCVVASDFSHSLWPVAYSLNGR